MDTQLRLLSQPAAEPEWRLDDDTRRVGLEGIAHARQILGAARRREQRAEQRNDQRPDQRTGAHRAA